MHIDTGPYHRGHCLEVSGKASRKRQSLRCEQELALQGLWRAWYLSCSDKQLRGHCHNKEILGHGWCLGLEGVW